MIERAMIVPAVVKQIIHAVQIRVHALEIGAFVVAGTERECHLRWIFAVLV